ncbi:MAG: glycosyltransferase family 4 protein [Promethearchaeota archaeon]
MSLKAYSDKLAFYSPNKEKSKIKFKKNKFKILRIICQRPYYTGSGINFINLIRHSNKHGIEQAAMIGQPAGEENQLKELLPAENTYFVRFKNDNNNGVECDVPFSIPGMSDKMPYKSTKFSDFTQEMLETYLSAFAEKITRAVNEFRPNIIHTHHLWLVSALTRVLCQDIPIITTCHNTALRQMVLASQFKDLVVNPIRDLDGIAVIGSEQEHRVKEVYEFNDSLNNTSKFFHISQGINTNVFYPPECIEHSKKKTTKKIVYVGKLCFSKGLPQLLHAFKEIQAEIDESLELLIIGAGEGEEKEQIMELATPLNQSIRFLGQLNQNDLANCFRESDLFVLPSFFDGFPKVLLESLACGCKAIITDLPGIKHQICSRLGNINNISFIPQPSMKSIDKPLSNSLPDFVNNLKQALKFQLSKKYTSERDASCNKIRKIYSDDALFQKYNIIYNSFVY